jgi:hypothetical protein
MCPQSVNRASTERQQSVNRASAERQQRVNRASTECQQSINTASIECQQSVNNFGHCIFDNRRALARQIFIFNVLAVVLATGPGNPPPVRVLNGGSVRFGSLPAQKPEPHGLGGFVTRTGHKPAVFWPCCTRTVGPFHCSVTALSSVRG